MNRSVRLTAVLALMLAAAAPLPLTTEPIAQEWADSGSTSTRPFTIKGPWELQWSASKNFAASLMTPEGRVVENIASKWEPGFGKTYFPKGGTYYLDITSSGSWEARVVSVKN